MGLPRQRGLVHRSHHLSAHDALIRAVPRSRLARHRGNLREGLSYVRQRRELLVPIVLVGVVGTFGLNFQITLALVDKVVFHRGAASFGLLSALLAVGALAGALLGARRTHPTTRLVILGAIAFGVLEVVAGLMPTFAVLAVALIPLGFANITFSTAANSSVQLASAPEMRGRVMGIYMLVFAGGTPLGAPLVGWISQEFGARWGLIGGGVISAGAEPLCWLCRSGGQRQEAASSRFRSFTDAPVCPGPRPARSRSPLLPGRLAPMASLEHAHPFEASLADIDPEISAAIDSELARQRSTLDLVASESVPPRAVLEAQGSILTAKYADGYPGQRTYDTCEWIDEIESLAIGRAKAVFGAGHANVQPYSGASANAAVLHALCEPAMSCSALTSLTGAPDPM